MTGSQGLLKVKQSAARYPGGRGSGPTLRIIQVPALSLRTRAAATKGEQPPKTRKQGRPDTVFLTEALRSPTA